MKYLDFLKQELPSDWVVCDELNIDWDGNTTTAILKTQTGTKFNDSEMIPLQLIVLTNDPIAAKDKLMEFITANHNKYFIEDINTFCKQYYYTPVIPTVATPSGHQLVDQIIMTGTLLKSVDVSDISEVIIDGTNYQITECNIGYSTDANAQIIIKENVNGMASTHIKKATVVIDISMINKNNPFCNELRLLRLDRGHINKTYNLKLKYSDNETSEPYSVKLTSFAINSTNGALPTLKVTFALGE